MRFLESSAAAVTSLDNTFDLICDVRNRFAYRPSNMVSDGNTADFSQMLIYQ